MHDEIAVEGPVTGKTPHVVEPWDFPGDNRTWAFGIWMRNHIGQRVRVTAEVIEAKGGAMDEQENAFEPHQRLDAKKLSWDACPMPERVERLRKEIQSLRREYGYLLRDVAGVRNLFRRLKSHSHDPQGKPVVPVDVDSVVDLVIREEQQKAGREDPLA